MQTLPPYSLPIDHSVPEGELIREERQENVEEVDSREKTNWFRFITRTTNPKLYSFPANQSNNNGKAILILPGGGYAGVSIDREGFDFARMFNAQGYSAFVLKYRMPRPYDDRPANTYAPLEDSTRAIRIIRSRAAQYGINPSQVGIMGFSAGAHLAAMTSNIYNDIKEEIPELAKYSARPDFSILVYPVISFKPEYTHMGSHDLLLGDDQTKERELYFSMEERVTQDTPTTFLTQTMDDPINVNNALLYAQACHKAGVPAEMHIFSEGGHGYGIPWPQSGRGVETWPQRMLDWLERI